MSIKDLFNKELKNFQAPVENMESASVGAESRHYIIEKSKTQKRFVPPLDFSTASNFVKFGSAELYYEFAWKRISSQYPYDGSLAEKQEFYNNSTHFDRYIFDNLYPRTNGYVKMGYGGFDGTKNSTGYNDAVSKEYIYSYGGIHTNSAGMTGKKLSSTFSGSMVYNVTSGSKMGSSYEFDVTSGSTIEFWMKKKQFNTTYADSEVVFDLWNQEADSPSSTTYGRALLEITSSTANGERFKLSWYSGSTNATALISPSTLTIADNKWHHYAVSMKKESSNMKINFYRDGRLENTTNSATVIGDIKGRSKGIRGVIGALNTAPSGTTTLGIGDGKLSASLDEFRYWKVARTPKEIGLDWFSDVGGGTNIYDYNKNLGVYYKFNEGITGNSSLDSTVLDYSGRITNGEWVGYSSGARSTDSAIVLSGKASKEFKDPIIYMSHPDVTASMTRYKASGSLYDLENPGLFFNLMPSWLQEEDELAGNNLKYLSQIMASYFDTLYSQINYVTKFKDKRYYDENHPVNKISNHALTDSGFVLPNMFVEANIVETFRERDVNEIYSGDIEKVKSMIYQNIYNNILFIQKSKGTEKSFRNLFRCFGVDTEIIKLQLYSDNSTQVIKDNYEYKSVTKPVLNLYHPDNLDATVFQSGSNGITFVTGSETEYKEEFTSLTLECEFILPKKLKRNQNGYFVSGFVSSSIAGFHRALTSSAADFTWHAEDSPLKIYAIKDAYDGKHVQFKLTGSNLNLTSSFYRNSYDSEKWLLAAKVRHGKYPFAGLTGSNHDENYVVEFYGIHTTANYVNKGPFFLTASISNSDGKKLLSNAKRVYAGAHRQNFTGSILEYSDAKISQVRLWQSYLDNDALKQHAYDPTNYGVEHPLYNDNPFLSKTIEVPKIETLALHWDFMTVTGSDSSGEFTFEDASSGSVSDSARYGIIGKITRNKHDGKGENFILNSAKAVDKEFIHAAKRRLPDSNYSSDGVKIVSEEVEAFFDDDDRSDNFYSFEKSPYSAISDEMINVFATVQEFSNMIGDPVNRYRESYKSMDSTKALFFDNVSNTPDPERYFEYFKWIDSSISFAISQLVPASNRFSDGIRNVVESHVLERNKFVEKFPMVAPESPNPNHPIKGMGELGYSWKFGHAPLGDNENVNCLWQRIRRRLNDADSNVVRDKKYKNNNYIVPKVYDIVTSQAYEGNALAIRTLNKPYRFSGTFNNTIHGGTNYYAQKNRNLVHDVCHPLGQRGYLGIPANVLAIGIGEGQGLISSETVCEDIENPNEKEKYNFVGVLGEYTNTYATAPIDDSKEHLYRQKGARAFPMNIMSQSVQQGYSKRVQDLYRNKTNVANLHSDTIDRTNEVPMQGPFTEAYVGGHQSRHIRLNRYNPDLKTEGGGSTTNNLDDKYTRPEAWRLLLGDHDSSPHTDGTMVFTPADYGVSIITGKYPDVEKKLATRFRGETAKRPINVRNIAHDGYNNRAGNYNKRREYINVVAGKSEMNLYFRANSDKSLYLPSDILTELPDTTHVMTLAAQTAAEAGNVFGTTSNRQPASIVKAVPDDLIGANNSKNETVIRTKFSAPGGIEIESPGYLDVYSRERSVHNALPYRNLSVRGAGSGENGTIRVNSHMGTREGLKTLLSRHSGRFGVDSEYGNDLQARFDGTNCSIKIGTSATWNTILSGRLYSTSFWINWWQLGVQVILAFDETDNFISVDGHGKIDFRTQWNGANTVWETTNNVVTTDRWYHIALTYVAGVSEEPILYINGEIIPWAVTPTPSGTWDAFDPTSGGHDVLIGSLNGTSFELKAYVDEFAIWSRILSSAEVVKIEGNGRKGSLDNLGVKSNLELWYGMGDGTDNRFKIVDSNSKMHDMSGNERHSQQVDGVNIELKGEYTGNFHNYHRNTTYRLEDGSFQSRPHLVGVKDNAHVSTQLPRSEFQYSWIDTTLGHKYGIRSGQQYIYGYQSKNGEEIVDINDDSYTVKPSITFPTGSDLSGDIR